MTTRQRILEEATRQLLAKGYTAFTIAGVRDALGLSSGSMFHAFASKPALVGEVYVQGMRDYQDAAIVAITSSDDPAPAIGAWIEVHLSWVTAHRELARFLFATPPDEVIAASAAGLADANAAFYKAVDDLFASAVDAGLMAPSPLEVGHSLVMGPTQEYCRRWTRGAADAAPITLAGPFTRAAHAALLATRTEE